MHTFSNRSRLCTELNWVVQNGVGASVLQNSMEASSLPSNDAKLMELMARMETIRTSVGSSEEAVRKAAMAADISGRNDILLDPSTIEADNRARSQSMPSTSDVGCASFLSVVASAPTIELEVPAPLGEVSRVSCSGGVYSPTALAAASGQSSSEYEVPAPISPKNASPTFSNSGLGFGTIFPSRFGRSATITTHTPPTAHDSLRPA